MDSEDGITVSDNTAVEHEGIEQRHEPASHISSIEDSIEEREILRQKIDGNGISAENLSITTEFGSDADNSIKVESTSDDGPLASAIREGNISQSREIAASTESLFQLPYSKRIYDDAKRQHEIRKHALSKVMENINKSTKDFYSTDFYSAPPISDARVETVSTAGKAAAVRQTSEARAAEFYRKIALAGIPLRGMKTDGDSIKKDSDFINTIMAIPLSAWGPESKRNLSESEIQCYKARAAERMARSMNRALQSCPQDVGSMPRDSSVVCTDKSAVLEPVSGDTIPPGERGDTVVPPPTQPGVEESGEDDERKAIFYISSSSIPGMEEGWEWPSVSGGYQMPSEIPVRRPVGRQDSTGPRKCLGTQQCHYIVLAVALLAVVVGCIFYHLSNSGIVPAVLKPIGASTAFISFAVCIFSSIYITYLRNYPQLPSVLPNYEVIGDVESVLDTNKASNTNLFCTEDGYYIFRNRTASPESNFRQTQSADVLERRGYRILSTGSQTEVKRISDESGTAHPTQSPKRFKAENADMGSKRPTKPDLESSAKVPTAVRPNSREEIYYFTAPERSNDGQAAFRPDAESKICSFAASLKATDDNAVVKSHTGKEMHSFAASERSTDDLAALRPDAELETGDGQGVDSTQRRLYTPSETPPDSQSSDDSSESETKPLLPKKDG